MSDATFRVHDWGRVGADGRPRALHLAEALESTDFDAGPVGPLAARPEPIEGGTRERLARSPFFALERLRLRGPARVGRDDRFTIVLGLAGSAEVRHEDRPPRSGTARRCSCPRRSAPARSSPAARRRSCPASSPDEMAPSRPVPPSEETETHGRRTEHPARDPLPVARPLGPPVPRRRRGGRPEEADARGARAGPPAPGLGGPGSPPPRRSGRPAVTADRSRRGPLVPPAGRLPRGPRRPRRRTSLGLLADDRAGPLPGRAVPGGLRGGQRRPGLRPRAAGRRLGGARLGDHRRGDRADRRGAARPRREGRDDDRAAVRGAAMAAADRHPAGPLARGRGVRRAVRPVRPGVPGPGRRPDRRGGPAVPARCWRGWS